MPPTKPIFFDFDAIAAATPTRYEPSSSLNRIELTLLPLATESISTKRTFGNSCATFCTAWVCEKPTAAIRSSFLRARPRMTCSAWVSLLAWTSMYLIPVSFLKRSAPSNADWLNDLSNLPPAS